MHVYRSMWFWMATVIRVARFKTLVTKTISRNKAKLAIFLLTIFYLIFVPYLERCSQQHWTSPKIQEENTTPRQIIFYNSAIFSAGAPQEFLQRVVPDYWLTAFSSLTLSNKKLQ